MKKSLSVLFGAALLASCSLDDGIDMKPNGAANNQQAPVFRVSLDKENDTRAIFGTNNKYGDDDAKKKPMASVNLESGDLLSLYNGAPLWNDDNEWQTTNNFNQFTNAIYKGAAGSADNGLTFTSQAMVLPGGAIMVYPADTEFANQSDGRGSYNPIIKIETAPQPAGYSEKTPYMSEVIKVKDLVSKAESTKDMAGYANEYDITLKRVGMNLILNVTVEGAKDANKDLAKIEGADPIRVEEVVITNVTPVFTSQIGIKAKENDDNTEPAYIRDFGQYKRYGETPNCDPEDTDGKRQGDIVYKKDGKTPDLKLKPNSTDPVTDDVHTAWVATSIVDKTKPSELTTNNKQVAEISTQDILATNDEETFAAVFTLLPFLDGSIEDNQTIDNTLTDAALTTSTNKATMVTLDDNVSITIKTNYGDVTIQNDNRDKNFVNPNNNTKYSIKSGLGMAFAAVYHKQTKVGSTFREEEVGDYAERSMKTKVGDLVMQTMCVKNETALKNAKDIIAALGSTQKPKILLEGESNTKKEFVMSVAGGGVAAYTALSTGSEPLQIGLCSNSATNHTKCEKVVLSNSGAAQDVPTLLFAAQSARNVPVALRGDWNLGQVKYQNVESVTAEGKVTLAATVSAVDPAGQNGALLSYAAAPKLVFDTNADVTLTGKTELKLVTENKGKITINQGQRLRATSNGVTVPNGKTMTLTNMATVTTQNNVTTIARGTIIINGNGILGVEEKQNAEVINLGKIDISTATRPNVLLASNQTAGAKVSQAPANVQSDGSGGNLFGIIDCGDKSKPESCTITGTNLDGFIMSTIKDNTDLEKRAGINYLVVNSEKATNITNVGNNKTIHEDVKYIELNKVNSGTSGATLAGTYNAVIIKEEVQVTVKETLTIDDTDGTLCLKGDIIKPGTIEGVYENGNFNEAKFKGYFGTGSSNNITSGQ